VVTLATQQSEVVRTIHWQRSKAKLSERSSASQEKIKKQQMKVPPSSVDKKW